MIVLERYQLRVLSAFLINLSAGWFASIFFLLDRPRLLIFSLFLAILCMYLALVIEGHLDKK